MRHVAIVGVGLIGGSLGKALRRVRRGGRRMYRVSGLTRRAASARAARQSGCVDTASTDPRRIIPLADIVVICAPVQFIAPLAGWLAPLAHPKAVFTDVGSVKARVLAAWRREPGAARVPFVGAHPIAGSEKAGLRYADASLFRGAVCVVTPEGAPRAAVAAVKRMWEDVGARSLAISAARHDRLLALVSHLPHLLSFALFDAARAMARRDPLLRAVAGGSFRDMTRVAASDPGLWRGIFDGNRVALGSAERAFLSAFRRLSSASGRRLARRLQQSVSAKHAWPEPKTSIEGPPIRPTRMRDCFLMVERTNERGRRPRESGGPGRKPSVKRKVYDLGSRFRGNDDVVSIG